MKKTILITGATAGIGKACAEKFAQDGHTLILTGRRKARLEALAVKLQSEYAVQVWVLHFDIQKKSEVEAAVNSLPTSLSAIDILINNAGLAMGKDAFDEADIADWETMLQTNVHGLLYMTKAVLPLLKKSSSAHIINIGSTAAKEVYQNGSVYCASKSAVEAISKGMRIDLLPLGIKVTCVHPGAAETEFSLVRFKNDAVKAAETYQGFQPLTATDIADCIYYCANLPAHVCINDLVLTSLQQANSYYIHRNK